MATNAHDSQKICFIFINFKNRKQLNCESRGIKKYLILIDRGYAIYFQNESLCDYNIKISTFTNTR